MKVQIHHQNFSTSNVAGLTEFYKNVFNLEENEESKNARITTQYNGETNFLKIGDGELHIAESNPNMNFITGQHVNPLLKGHLALRVDDIQQVIENLEKHNIPYADNGQWAIKGWHQIFLHDPDGNVIEVHQVIND